MKQCYFIFRLTVFRRKSSNKVCSCFSSGASWEIIRSSARSYGCTYGVPLGRWTTVFEPPPQRHFLTVAIGGNMPLTGRYRSAGCHLRKKRRIGVYGPVRKRTVAAMCRPFSKRGNSFFFRRWRHPYPIRQRPPGITVDTEHKFLMSIHFLLFPTNKNPFSAKSVRRQQ